MHHGRIIVVLCHRALGDCLMALPFLRNCDASLRTNDRMIVLVDTKVQAEVMRIVHWKGNVQTWQGPLSGIKGRLKLIAVLRKLRALKPDLVLAPLLSDRLWGAVWLALMGARKSVVLKGRWLGRWGRCAFVQPRRSMHKTEEFLQHAVVAGFPEVSDRTVQIPLSAVQTETARNMLPGWNPQHRWIAFGPGSGAYESHKRCPAEMFQQVARLLLDYSTEIRIVVLGTPAEKPLLESLLGNGEIDTTRCCLFSDLSLLEAIAVLAECECMVSGCSGPSHMAAAAGIPIVGVYGPTNPGRTGPYTRKLRVVRSGLKCSPCYRYGFRTGCGDPICMRLVKPEAVFKAVLDCLNGAPYQPVPWYDMTNATKPAYPKEQLAES